MRRNNQQASALMNSRRMTARGLGAVLASGFLISTAWAAGHSLPFTQTQAKAGQAVYSSQCASCHGKNLQGVAAPAIGGTKFLQTAERNKWNLQTIDQIVVNNMPFSAPGSLTPTQYADVMAYLLAANCFTASGKPFPATAPSGFAKIQMQPLSNKPSGADKNGVCPVKS